MSLITSESKIIFTIPFPFLMTDIWEAGIHESDVVIASVNTYITFKNAEYKTQHLYKVNSLIDIAYKNNKNKNNKMLNRLKSDIAQLLKN